MRGIDQQAAVAQKQRTDYSLTHDQHDLQNRISLDQTTGNLGDLAKAYKASEDFNAKHAKALGLDASDLALQKAQDQRNLRASLTPTPPPFHQNQPGVGALQAGPGSTAVRFGGGRDPQLEEIRALRTENQRLRTELATYLQQIARNTAAQQAHHARGALPPH